MKTETAIAIAALPSALATGLGSAWISVSAARRLQTARYEREDQNALNGALDELLLSALQFSVACQMFHIRWTDAASPLQRMVGSRRALSELDDLVGAPRERFFKVALQASRWQEEERQPIKQAALDLIEAGADLFEVVGQNGSGYAEASQKYQDAFKAIRQAINAWDSPIPRRGLGARLRRLRSWLHL